ncbi:hypothetical protein BH09ACT9_BH09ACT9_00820 [soil metagenome]
MNELLWPINSVIWVLSNLLVAYIAAALLVFVIAYPVFFDPGATTAGKFVLRFAASLIGVIGLVFVGLFIDPRIGALWWQFPGDIVWWRPTVRFAIFVYVAYTVSGLVGVLWLRKFRPHLLRIAPDDELPVKVRRPRNDLEKPS